MVIETEGIRADGPTPPTTPGPVVYCDTVNLSPERGVPDGHDGGHPHHGGHQGHDGRGGPGDHGGGFRHG